MFFFWTMQGVWVLVTIFPVLLVTSLLPPSNAPLGMVEYTGWGIWAIGWTMEVVADKQKDAFRKRRSKPGYTGKGWINEGVWTWCQHPNYFGEITLWWGVWISTGNALPLAWWVGCGLCPLFLTFLI